ncbi:MAG: hypothetical protein RJA57_1735 [Bacteroidota bacterium]|jgi:predicted RNA-binding protein with PUA-like domain
MNYWLVKSEPFVYSWETFLKEKQTCWSGVRNFSARLNLRAMRKGDPVFFYHSNEGLAIVGVATVSREAYPDPTTTDDRWVAVDLKAGRSFPHPVTLDQVKKDPRLKDMALVRISRLSVQPVTPDEWDTVMTLGGMS